MRSLVLIEVEHDADCTDDLQAFVESLDSLGTNYFGDGSVIVTNYGVRVGQGLEP